MKMKNIAAVAMAGCMAASLAACGGSASSAASSAASTEAATSEAAEATGTSANGFTVQLGSNPETLDPALNSAIDGANTLITVFEPLLLIDENNEVVPGQADLPEVSEDGLTWTFTMKDGLKWSDGSDLTAKDFEYSFKRLACPDTAAPYAETVVGMIDGYQDAIGNPDADGNTTTDPDWDALNVHASEDGKTLTIYAEKDDKDLPWGKIGVDVVLECTGFYTSKAKSQAHIDAGAKKVVISAPAGNDLKTIVYSVNEKTLTADDTIISAASCTTNCLAPMADTLNKYAEIQSGIMSTIHAYTGDQMILDGPHRKGDKRRARAGAANIVPNSTGAAKAIGLVIPELNGKLIGSAQRVPVPTGSTTILTSVVEGEVTVEEVNAAMKAATTPSFGYTEEPLVSSDIVGITYGSLFDATQTRVMEVKGEQLVKVAACYDNEMSYTSQLVRTLEYFAKIAK